MPSAHELRAELKNLREQHPDYKPVSRMKKADISSLIERMKQHTEITPAIAMTKNDPVKPAPGEIKKVKAVNESMVEKLPKDKKAKAEPKVKAEPKTKAEPKAKAKANIVSELEPLVKHEKTKEKVEPKEKISMAERMAKLRAMRKKKE